MKGKLQGKIIWVVLTGRVACYMYDVFHSQMKISIASRLFVPLA